jgi:KaiC/GvpD/RAD55 family RecA-like ATPase
MASVSEDLSKMGSGEIALVVTSAVGYSGAVPDVLKTFANRKDYYGIYITVNKPYASLSESFRKAGINLDGVFFVDCVTKMVGGMSKPSDRFLTIESPQFLTEMSIAVSQAMSALPKGEKYLILDSISSLLIYNSPGTVARFIHFLSGKLREWGARGVFLAVDKEVESLLPYVSQFVDKTVQIR